MTPPPGTAGLPDAAATQVSGVSPGPLALVGSGEYLPVMQDVERDLLVGRPSRFVQLPTGAGLEGPDSVAYWTRLGRDQAARLGVEAVPLAVLDRADADDPALAAQVDGAGLIYLSGGDPRHVAQTLRGSLVWAAIVAAWRGGAALAGCSAGAMAMAAQVPDIRRPGFGHVPGLSITPDVQVLPHFDRYFGRLPTRVAEFLAHVPPGVMLLGVDEDTAVVGGPDTWQVVGRQSAWVLTEHQRVEYPAGAIVLTGPEGRPG